MSRVRRALPVLVALLSVLAFLPALDAGFVNWDDEVSFLKNKDYRGLGWAQFRWMLTATLLGHYTPLTWMTWGLNYVLGGLDPWGYHLGNLLLHATNAALFYLIARRLLSAGFAGGAGGWPVGDSSIAFGAAFAALVFAVHPLRAESVAWVSERRDVLCGLFYLLAAWAYLRGVADGGAIRMRWWGLSLGAFTAALLSKAIAVTLPLSLVLLDAYPLRRLGLGWRRLAGEKVPYALLAAGAAVVAVSIRHEGGALSAYEQYGPGARLSLAAHSFWFYPWKLVWPVGLSPIYELPARVDPWQGRFLGPLIGVAAITAALLLVRRRWPWGLTAWAHSAIVLAPVSGIVHSGSQLAHDRYSYLSGLGFAVLGGAGLVWALRGGPRGRAAWVPLAASGTALVVLLGLGAGTWGQSGVWRDSETLWRAAVEVDPACSVCHSNLGAALVGTGRLAEAESHVRRAITLRPDRPGPHENLGVIMLAARRYGEAETHFRRVVALRPEHGASRNNLGVALAQQGRDAEAEAEFRQATRLAGRLVDAPANLGALYVGQGRYAEAIVPLRQALRMDAEFPGVKGNMARALRSRAVELVSDGKLGAGIALWQEAQGLAADDPQVLRALGQALVEQGKGAEAVPALERAVALNPRGARERFWLARAYRLAGEPARAQREIAALRAMDPALAAELGP